MHYPAGKIRKQYIFSGLEYPPVGFPDFTGFFPGAIRLLPRHVEGDIKVIIR